MKSLRQMDLNGNQLLLLVKVVVLLGSILSVYRNDLSIMFNQAISSDLSSYVLVIPFLIGYIVYRKRDAFKAATAFDLSNRNLTLDSIEGAIIMAAALLFYWNSSFSSSPLTSHALSIPFFLFGAVLVLFGKNTLRTAVFPTFLLFFMTPLPSDIITYWGGVLAIYTSSASVALIQLLGVGATTTVQYGNPVVEYPSLAGGQVAFAVSIACSGLYSLTGFAAFAAFAAYIPRGRILAKITLFGVGFALIYALNILRVTIILLMGRYYGEGAALQTFHTFAGTILIFLGTLGLLYAGEKIWRLKFARARISSAKCNHDESHVDLLGGFCSACGRFLRLSGRIVHKRETGTILIVAILTVLMLLAQVPLFAYVQGPNPDAFSIPAGNTSPPGLLPTVNFTQGSWTPTFLYRDQAFEQFANGYVDAAWLYAYYPSQSNSSALNPILTSIELGYIPTSDYYLDPPYRSEVDLQTQYNCNGAGGATYIIYHTDSVLENSTSLIGTLYSFSCPSNPTVQEIRYFWKETGTFRKGSTYVTDMMLTAIHATGDQLIAAGLISDPNNATQIQAAMRSFALQIVQYWGPVQGATLQSRYLASIRLSALPWLTVALLAGAAFAGFREVTDSVGESQLEAMIGKLQTPEDKALINEFYKKRRRETAEEARLGLSANGYKPSLEEVVAKLTAAEKLGLLRRKLTWVGEQAIQRWGQPRVDLRIDRIRRSSSAVR